MLLHYIAFFRAETILVGDKLKVGHTVVVRPPSLVLGLLRSHTSNVLGVFMTQVSQRRSEEWRALSFTSLAML